MGKQCNARGWAIYASARLLAADAEQAEEKPVWIEVAREGEFKGHPSGSFNLTKADLQQVVDNFHAHPSYHAGEGGIGDARVVAFDFHHASEQKPADVAVHGAPAQAWALDLKVLDGADGHAQLWALTEYLEPARTYVLEGKYQGTSVAIWPDAVDPVTGKNIGWYLSSIAFTNDPFIQGMIPIAAARGCCTDMLRARIMAAVAGVAVPAGEPNEGEPASKAATGAAGDDAIIAELLKAYPWDQCVKDQVAAGKSQESAEKICGYIKAKNAERVGEEAVAAARRSRQLDGNRYGWFSNAGSAEDAVEQMRRLFGIPVAASVADELAKIVAIVGGAPAPEGLIIADVCDALRQILGLPLLTSTEEVLQQATTMVVTESTVAAATASTKTASASGQRAGVAPGSNRSGEPFMKLDETLKMLAARFGMPLSEDEVMKRVLAELEAGGNAKDAVTKLLALLEDSKTLEAASAKLAEYKAALAEFEQVLPELKAMAENTSAVEDEQAVSDVAQAMQAIRSSDERVRGALLSQRTNGADLKALATALKGEKVLSKFVSCFQQYRAAYGKRLEARDAFRKQYTPPDAKGPEPSYLTRSLASPEPQVQSPFLRALSADGAGVRSGGVPATSEPRLGEGEAGLLAEIEKCAGVNITAKAMSYVGAQPGGNKLSFEQCHEEACKLLQRARNGSR